VTTATDPRVAEISRELAELRAEMARTQERAGQLLDAMVAIASGELHQPVHVGYENDVFDGLAIGLNTIMEEFRSAATILHDVLEFMDDAVIAVDLSGRITLANRAACRLVGRVEAELKGEPVSSVLTTFPARALSEGTILELAARDDEDAYLSAVDGRRIPVFVSISAMRHAQGEVTGAICVARDITERKRVERERAEMRGAIEKQAALILEMSTPLVPIWDGIVVMPLLGGVDDARARRIIAALLEGVARHRARAAILDITGVAVVDSHVAGMLLQAVAAARLLGARVILTGVRPDVAGALVSLGVDMSGVTTAASLQRGFMSALRGLHEAPR
jgi:rsbT co-antagonist protein RsbR